MTNDFFPNRKDKKLLSDIRTERVEEKTEFGKRVIWLFSIVDMVRVKTDSARPHKYWSDLRRKFKHSRSELFSKIGRLKMMSADGKHYLTDVADYMTLMEVAQIIPRPATKEILCDYMAIKNALKKKYYDPRKNYNKKKHG